MVRGNLLSFAGTWLLAGLIAFAVLATAEPSSAQVASSVAGSAPTVADEGGPDGGMPPIEAGPPPASAVPEGGAAPIEAAPLPTTASAPGIAPASATEPSGNIDGGLADGSASVSQSASVPPASVPPSETPAVVQVHGNRLEESLPKELKGYGTRVVTIDRQQIQNAGQPDVATSLEALAPGLYITPKNGPFDYVDVSLQGSSTADVLWLLDGVRLNNRLYAGTTPLDTFPASIVDHFDMVEGPEALFYGTQAVAGAINIATLPFSDRTDGAIALGADTLGGRHLDANVRTSFGPHHFVIYGSGDQSDGYQAFRSQDYQPSATDRKRGYELLTLGAKYGFDVTRDLHLTALYQHTDGKVDFAQPFLIATAFNQREEEIVTGKVEYDPGPLVQVYLKGYYHLWRSHYTEYDNTLSSSGEVTGPLTVVEDDGRWGFEDFGGTAVAKVAPTRWFDAFVGYDVQSYDGSDAVLVITQRSEQVHAVFGELRTPEQWTRLRLAAGARYNVPTVGPSAAVWNATGQYSFADPLLVRFNIGTAFRLPTAEELFANDPDDELGNPNLRPERSFNMEASVAGRTEVLPSFDLSWDVVGFYRDVTDLISASGFDSATNQSVFENLAGTVYVRGATAVVGASLPAWTIRADYTYASAEDQGLQIDKVPRHLVKGSVDWHPTTLPVGATLLANYVGNLYQTFGPTDREMIDAHAVFTVAARVFLDRDRRHKINASLSNILNTTYASSLGKGVSDVGGGSYTYWNLGAPRTLSVRYSYHF